MKHKYLHPCGHPVDPDSTRWAKMHAHRINCPYCCSINVIMNATGINYLEVFKPNKRIQSKFRNILRGIPCTLEEDMQYELTRKLYKLGVFKMENFPLYLARMPEDHETCLTRGAWRALKEIAKGDQDV